VIALFQIATLRWEALAGMIVSRTRRLSTYDKRHRQQATMDERLTLNNEQDRTKRDRLEQLAPKMSLSPC